MSINFTTNVEPYTTARKGNNRTKHFMEYTSKKQLQNDSSLTDDELDFALSIKGTFSYALHEDGRYMAVTLYRANTERKYSFLVVDLQEQAIAEVDSIKTAKMEILELVGQYKLADILEEEFGQDEEDEILDENAEQFADEMEDAVVEELAKDEPSPKKKSSKK